MAAWNRLLYFGELKGCNHNELDSIYRPLILLRPYATSPPLHEHFQRGDFMRASGTAFPLNHSVIAPSKQGPGALVELRLAGAIFGHNSDVA